MAYTHWYLVIVYYIYIYLYIMYLNILNDSNYVVDKVDKVWVNIMRCHGVVGPIVCRH